MANALAIVGQYSKFIVAMIGAISAGLSTEFPASHWVPVVVTVLSAIAVYLIPNEPDKTPPLAADPS